MTVTRVTTDRRVGGMNAVATLLGVSRQQVYAWYCRRDHNDFPAPVGRARSGHRGLLFNLAAVAAWHHAYVPSVGGRPPHVK